MSFVVNFFRDWFGSFLEKIGLTSKEATIVIIGLDNAGKTTLLYKLKSGSVKTFVPTQRANMERVHVGNLKIHAWDLGGHDQVRHLWRQYLPEADAVVFIVDSADRERLGEAAAELHGILEEKDMAGTPIAVLANKMDLPNALPRDQMLQALNLAFYQQNAQLPVQLFQCSFVATAAGGYGHDAAFKWISSQL
nr:SarB [Planomonas micra]